MKKLLFISIIFYSNLSFSGHGFQDCVLKCNQGTGCQPSGKKYICHKVFSPGNDQPICVNENSDHDFGFVHGGDFPDFPLKGDLPDGYTCGQFVRENVNDLNLEINTCDGNSITGDGNSLDLTDPSNPVVSLYSLRYNAKWDLCVKFNISQTRPGSPWPPLYTINPVLRVDHNINISHLIEEGDMNYLSNSGLSLVSDTRCTPDVFSDTDDYPFYIGEEQPITKSFQVFGTRFPYPSECKTILHFQETSNGERKVELTKLKINLENTAQIIFRNDLTF
jgi:hypothetical protein